MGLILYAVSSRPWGFPLGSDHCDLCVCEVSEELPAVAPGVGTGATCVKIAGRKPHDLTRASLSLLAGIATGEESAGKPRLHPGLTEPNRGYTW